MTNKPMLSVERELLEVVAGFIAGQADAFPLISVPRGLRSEGLDQVSKELRALLDKPAAQHQGEPVKVAFSALSYGAKFEYDVKSMRGHAYVKIGHNEIAEWDEKFVAASWVTQGLFSFASDDSKLSEEVYLITESEFRAEQPAPVAVMMPDVDDLSQIIRKVDGSHNLGAGALAEAILAEISRLSGVSP